MDVRSLYFCNPFKAVIDIRRQNLTSNVGSRAELLNNIIYSCRYILLKENIFCEKTCAASDRQRD